MRFLGRKWGKIFFGWCKGNGMNCLAGMGLLLPSAQGEQAMVATEAAPYAMTKKKLFQPTPA
jgi:hypothetical protein